MKIEYCLSARNSFQCMSILCVWLFLTVDSCAPVPTFPDIRTTIIRTPQDFAGVKDPTFQSQNDTLQLAGRIIRSETTLKGVTFHAEWLPFPENTFAGPESLSTGLFNRRFSMLFPGIIDHEVGDKGMSFSWLDNSRKCKKHGRYKAYVRLSSISLFSAFTYGKQLAPTWSSLSGCIRLMIDTHLH